MLDGASCDTLAQMNKYGANSSKIVSSSFFCAKCTKQTEKHGRHLIYLIHSTC